MRQRHRSRGVAVVFAILCGLGLASGTRAIAEAKKIVLKGPKEVCRALAYSPDGTRLAAAYGRDLVLWDPATAKEVWRAKVYANIDHSLAFSKDGAKLLVLDLDGNLLVLETATGKEIAAERIRDGSKSTLGTMALSPDGKWVAISYGEPMSLAAAHVGTQPAAGKLRLWNVEARTVAATVEIGRFAGRVQFSPDSKVLAFWAPGNFGLRLVGVPSATARKQFRLVREFTFAPNGGALYAVDANQAVVVLSVDGTSEEPTARWTKGHTSDVKVIEVTSDGSLLATATTRSLGTPDPWVRLWDTKTGKRVGSVKSDPKETSSVAFSPDGKQLAVGGETTLKVYTVATLLE